MSDVLKIFGEMSFDNLFVLAGLAFLAVGVIGKISGKIDPSPSARMVAAVVGMGLIAAGLYIHRGHTSQGTDAAHAAPAVPPIKEVHADENAAHSHLEGHGPPAHDRAVGLSFYSGTWKNVDSETRGLTTLNVRTAGNSVWVHAWGRCHPSDCDWGEVSATAFSPGVASDPAINAQKVTAVFQTSFSNTELDLTPAADDSLEANTQTRFTDNSGRSPYSASYTFRH